MIINKKTKTIQHNKKLSNNPITEVIFAGKSVVFPL